MSLSKSYYHFNIILSITDSAYSYKTLKSLLFNYLIAGIKIKFQYKVQIRTE